MRAAVARSALAASTLCDLGAEVGPQDDDVGPHDVEILL